jgi:subtilisin-like proprotein convertase family protein/V8-like Glu-specific endopeptidase
MKFPIFPIVGTFLLATALTAEVQPKTASPVPIDPEQVDEDPFRYNGLVATDIGSGSGFCAWNRRTFFTAAHVLYGAKVWSAPPKYYPAANSLAKDETIAIQSRGYYHWTDYSTLSDTTGDNSPETFGRDVVLAFAFKPVIAGTPAKLNLNGLTDLKKKAKTLITGYPGENFYLDSPIEGSFMHRTGPVITPYRKLAGNALQTTLVTTGRGNSGGPIWTRNKVAEWVASGVLVGGRPSESVVYAFSKNTTSLLQAVTPVLKSKIEKPLGSSNISSFTTFFPCVKSRPIPDGVQRDTTFSIPVNTFSGDSKVVSVSLSLDIRTAHQGDLQIVLVAPSGVSSAVVHDEKGANKKNLILTDVNFSKEFSGALARGQWQLRVQDRLKGDIATFKSAVLEISVFDPVDVIETP